MRFPYLIMVGVAFLMGIALGVGGDSYAAATRPPASSPGTAPAGIFANFAPSVIAELQKRGMSGECPMCKKNQWVVHEVPVSLPVYESDGKVKFPGESMPTAAMICKNCGYMSFHSLGALGLINKAGVTTKP